VTADKASATAAGPAVNGWPDVVYTVADGVATITLNRPQRLNAVTPVLVEHLCSALDQAIADDVVAAVLTGAGRAFCSGHDLREEQSVITEREDRRRLQRLQDVTRKVRQAPFPVIAAVHGYALGAGCEFALCCDLIVAARDAIFGFPEVSVGLSVTGGITHLLPLIVGLPKAKELVLLGEQFGAQEALRLGLINRLAEPGQDVEEATHLARTLGGRPRLALARAKFALDQGAEAGLEVSQQIETVDALALHNTSDAELAADAFRHRAKHGTT
jgi:2-(1,2-epoxy-1,2-dihydrophenyl)acetyl-CoA isomerase